MTDMVKLADVETELRESLERGYSARAQAILADMHPADHRRSPGRDG